MGALRGAPDGSPSAATQLLTPGAAAAQAAAYNNVSPQTLHPSDVDPSCSTFVSIWPEQDASDQFVAICNDASGVPYWFELSWDGTQWVPWKTMDAEPR